MIPFYVRISWILIAMGSGNIDWHLQWLCYFLDYDFKTQMYINNWRRKLAHSVYTLSSCDLDGDA